MWVLDYKEGWVLKNWYFQIVVLEKMLESPLDSKEIKPVNPKGNQPWIFTERINAEAEAPILWSPNAKSQLFGKDCDAGKEWRQEKRPAEDEMVRYHHWLNGPEFEQTSGISEGQGSLVCCSAWGQKELHMTKWLNWTDVFEYLNELTEKHYDRNAEIFAPNYWQAQVKNLYANTKYNRSSPP